VTARTDIAANGDTAKQDRHILNGSAAKENNIPFYIAGAISTFDMSDSRAEQRSRSGRRRK